jgi:hypothetical protein
LRSELKSRRLKNKVNEESYLLIASFQFLLS